MLHPLLRVFLKFIIFLHYVNSENSPKQSGKLADDDLQMCVESFDVHKDKIIRTQDSLALGAKYIMEAEVDGRQDCLKLCCKSDECDVFIFEEKKQGSCYLFHCGPPQDFKCKFTSHANYSSAVRLEEQMRRSQQEHELKSLRKVVDRTEYIYTEGPALQVTETPKILIPTTSPPPIKIACSRNQYECRTSGDCIAIYNVCDGIPQCSDGSDEASDLGCPTEKPTPAPAPPGPLMPASELLKYPEMTHHKNYPPIYNNPEVNKPWQMNLPHQIVPQQQQTLQYGPPPAMMSNPQMNYGSSSGYMNGWEYRPMYDQSKEAGYSGNLIHPKADTPHYNREESHIFNHKRPGMMADNIPSGYIDPERPYESYFPRQNHESWQPEQSQPLEPQVKPQVPTKTSIVEKHQEPVETATPSVAASKEIKIVPNEVPAAKSNLSIKKELETQKNVHLEKDIKIISDKVTVSRKHVDLTKSDGKEKHLKPEDAHEELRMHHFVADHLHQSNHKDGNEVLRPRGAVISLAVGLTITAIMAALITCRLRVVRRRGRRGHGPYAHDADYLVNGMYL